MKLSSAPDAGAAGAPADEPSPQKRPCESGQEGQPKKRSAKQLVDRLRAERDTARARNAALCDALRRAREDNTALSTRVRGLETTVETMTAAGLAVPAAPASQPTEERPALLLSQVFSTPGGVHPREVKEPQRYSAIGAFPAAIATNKRTHRMENQLEGRRQTNFTFRVTKKATGECATERDIVANGVVACELELIYADNGAPVQAEDFVKYQVDAITSPPLSFVERQNMCNGEVSYALRFNVTSSETAPKKHRPFAVRVRVVDLETRGCDELCATSPPFIIRSKVSVPRAKQRAPVARGDYEERNTDEH